MLRLLLVPAVSTFATAAALCQTSQMPPELLGELRVPVHAAGEREAECWAAGASYKASFHDGMTFVPYLGEHYPHNQPWSWRTTSVRVGATELLDRTATVAVPGAYRFEYRRGPVTEAYDVRAAGLEQTFVLHRRPGPGDLVVTGVVTSALRAADSEAASRGLTFVDEQGQPVVGYGRAIAFDARGHRVEVHTAQRDGVVTLTVPGAWLEHALLPVTVDPLLTNELVQTSTAGSTVREIDVATWPNTQILSHRRMVVFTRAASSQDDDVYAVAFDEVSSPVVLHGDFTTALDCDDVSCACDTYKEQWIVAYRRYLPTAPIRTSRVGCHVHSVNAPLWSTSWIGVVPPPGSNDWRPRIASQSANLPDKTALLVFQRDDNSGTPGHWANTGNTSVCACLMNTALNTWTNTFVIRGNANVDVQAPSVSHGSGWPEVHWMVAYQVYDYATQRWDVEARRVPSTFGAMSAIGVWTSSIAGLGTHHQMGPIVEGQDGDYAVTFTTTDVATTPNKSNGLVGKQLQFERISWPHDEALPDASPPPTVLASNPAKVLEAHGLAYDFHDRSHYAIVFRQTSPPSLSCARVGHLGETTEGPSVVHTGTAVSWIACTFDSRNDTFLLAHAVNSGLMPVYVREFAYVTPDPTTTYGTGCTGTTIGWLGNRQIGAAYNRLTVTGNASDTHFPFVSLVPIDVSVPLVEVPAGCRLYVDPAAGGFLPGKSGANVNWIFPLPDSWTPLTIYVQDWSFDGVQVTSSPRLAVPLVR